MDRTSILNIDNVILILVLVWLVALTVQLYRVKSFEDSHKMLIQNRLDTQDVISGKTLDEVNAEAYKNAYELSSGLIVPSLILSMAVMGICFLLLEIKKRGVKSEEGVKGRGKMPGNDSAGDSVSAQEEHR